MSISKASICNMALIDFKANLVTDIDNPTTNEERICNTIFDQAVKETMIEGSWTSCVRREELVLTANTPVYGSDYEFQLPTDYPCLKVLDIYCGDRPYSIEGDKLYSDSNTAKIRYIYYNTNIASWDTLLVRSIVAKLKSLLAGPLTADLSRMQYADTKFAALTVEGLAVNSQGSHEMSNDGTLIDVRQE